MRRAFFVMTSAILKSVALAQLPVHVGDVSGNVQRILDAVRDAEREGARIVLCPELALLGYPPDDLLQRRGLPQVIEAALAQLADQVGDMYVVVGYPEFTAQGIYNAAAVLHDGRKVAGYRKQKLPNYGVFDERRHFLPGDQPCVFELEGQRYALSICEDLWSPDVAAQAAELGADVLLNINASPFDQDKRARRREVIAQRVAETGLAMVIPSCGRPLASVYCVPAPSSKGFSPAVRMPILPSRRLWRCCIKHWCGRCVTMLIAMDFRVPTSACPAVLIRP